MSRALKAASTASFSSATQNAISRARHSLTKCILDIGNPLLFEWAFSVNHCFASCQVLARLAIKFYSDGNRKWENCQWSRLVSVWFDAAFSAIGKIVMFFSKKSRGLFMLPSSDYFRMTILPILPKPESRAPRHRALSLPVFSPIIGNLGNQKQIANLANN